MKINPEQFRQYMLAKDALNKMSDAAFFQKSGCELTRDEILALFSQKVIDLEQNQLMLE